MNGDKIEIIRNASRDDPPLFAASLPAREEGLRIQIGRESERRYFIPVARLGEVVDLSELDHKIIRQSYLSREAGEVGLVFLGLSRYGTVLDQESVVTQLRIRETYSRSSGEYSYDLVIKVKNEDHLPTEREEISLAIDLATFDRLHSFCDGWTLTKARYGFPVGSSSLELAIEIDILLCLERGRERVASPGAGFAIVDVEVANRRLMASLVGGENEHPLLKRCLDISDDQAELGELRKPLSWRRLGERGLDKKARRAIEALHIQYEDLHR
ncbi:MAG: hypothetical protein RL417_2044 [Pseudomonadota bacterium]|jgi:hypothetical protein